MASAPPPSSPPPRQHQYPHQYLPIPLAQPMVIPSSPQSSTFENLSEPTVLLTTLIMDLQQRLESAETMLRTEAAHISNLGNAAVVSRSCIRAMMAEWRDLVLKIQLALIDHQTTIRALESRMTLLEAKVETISARECGGNKEAREEAAAV